MAHGNTVHGEGRTHLTTKEYKAWLRMKYRCDNPKHHHYHNYGGRGIDVCMRWRNSFQAFLSDVGRAPSSKHSIDRIDNDGDYEPSNVRWATAKEQAANQRPDAMARRIAAVKAKALERLRALAKDR